MLEYRAITILVSQRDAPVVAVEPHRAHAERPADRGTELVTVLRPAQRRIEAVVAGNDPDPTTEFPLIQLAEQESA